MLTRGRVYSKVETSMNSLQPYFVKLFVLTIVALLVVTAAAQKQAPSETLFAYDHSATLDVKEVSSREQDGVTIRDLNFASSNPDHKRVDAYLVSPKGTGKFAGLLFFHWLGEVKSDRNEFLDEAIVLAKRGTVSLLMQGYFPWTKQPSEAQQDRRQIINQVIEVRRALDLLLSQPNIDTKRIGFVGHDYGAMYGSLVGGIEKRVKTFVFLTAHPRFSDWSLKYWPVTAKAGEDVYRSAVGELDPVNYVSHAAPASQLFQFATKDKYIDHAAATLLYDAATNPKQIRWYETIHELNVPAAKSDREAWLAKQLKLPN
jgi:dienelactone hydrolase